MKSSTIYLNGKLLFVLSNAFSTSEITERICRLTELLPSDFYLTHNGKKLAKNTDQCKFFGNIHVNIRIFGGKGGFGSMLRAIGAQIEKTTNREACRDLSGRRLRDINEEKRMKAWLDKQKNRDAEARERKKKKLSRLMAVPKHEFKDSVYESQRSELTENLSVSIDEGLKQAASTAAETCTKRKITETTSSVLPKRKKANLWIDDGVSTSSDSDTSTNSESCTNTNVVKTKKTTFSDTETNKVHNPIISTNSKQSDTDAESSTSTKSITRATFIETSDKNIDVAT